MQDMESHIVDVGDMLRMEIEENEHAMTVINQLNGELLAAHNVVEILEGTVIDLENQLDHRDALIAEKDAQIAALHAQLNPPPPPPPNDDDDLDDDDEGGDEGEVNAPQEEE
jgi:hypothetical protein